MAKDPATLWYWNDWHSGTVTLSRHLKGCYMDLLHAQFNNGPLSLDEIKTVLGSDFGQAWLTLQKKFETDDKGLFFNRKALEERDKRRKWTESRRANLAKSSHMGKHMEPHMENENRNEIINEYEDWTELILDRNDQHFQTLLYNEKLSLSEPQYNQLVTDHMDLLHRYPKMRPSNQQSFRRSVIKHIKENLKKNGTNKKQQHTDTLIAGIAERWGTDATG